MRRHVLFGMILILGGAFLQVAKARKPSFLCSQTTTQVEYSICHDDRLTLLDNQVSSTYFNALKKAKNKKGIKQRQRKWLKHRNLCQDKACIAQLYTQRLNVLRAIPLKPFDAHKAKNWRIKREQDIKRTLKGMDLYIHSGMPSSTPFCRQLMADIKTLHNIEIIPPDDRAYGLYAPEMERHIFSHCPDIYPGASTTTKHPRKLTLYHVDIDNNARNGKEWLVGDHYVKRINPDWGGGLMAKSIYKTILLKQCRLGRSFSVGGSSQSYKPKTPRDIVLETGLHGVMRYRGKNYVYSLTDEPVAYFSLQEYNVNKNSPRSTCMIKKRHKQATTTQQTERQ